MCITTEQTALIKSGAEEGAKIWNIDTKIKFDTFIDVPRINSYDRKSVGQMKLNSLGDLAKGDELVLSGITENGEVVIIRAEFYEGFSKIDWSDMTHDKLRRLMLEKNNGREPAAQYTFMYKVVDVIVK